MMLRVRLTRTKQCLTLYRICFPPDSVVLSASVLLCCCCCFFMFCLVTIGVIFFLEFNNSNKGPIERFRRLKALYNLKKTYNAEIPIIIEINGI